MTKNVINLLLFIALMLHGCAIDDDIATEPCVNQELGTLVLAPSSSEAVVYFSEEHINNPKQYIYKNESGDEAVLSIVNTVPEEIISSSSFRKSCGCDNSKDIIYNHQIHYKISVGVIGELGLEFNFSLRTQLDWDDPSAENYIDHLVITGHEINFSQFEEFMFGLTIESRSSSFNFHNPQTFIETYELFNKTYTDVYSYEFDNDPFGDEHFDVHYNEEFGMVSFTDLVDQRWVLDRIE